MKKFISIIAICLIVVCCLVACKSTDDKKKKENDTIQETDFEKPIDYTTIIEVSVNPVFNLYLDSDNTVLAIEPVNDDAKSVIDEIKYDKKDAKSIITDLIKRTDEKGFLKKGHNIEVKMIETKMSEMEQSDLMNIIEKELKETFDDVTITSTIATEKKEQSENVTSEPTGQSKPVDSQTQSTHTHTYSKATCTQPQTCACGHTNGKELGHKWTEATCSVPKTCVTCGSTEGSAVEHSFDSVGKCKWCKQILPVSPSKLNSGAYCLVDAGSYLIGGSEGKYCPGINIVQLDFDKKEFICADLLEYEFVRNEIGSVIAEVNWYYNEIGYYDFEGGIYEFNSQIINNYIKIVVERLGTVELELLSNNTLKVISVSNGEFPYFSSWLPVGDILVYEPTPYRPGVRVD